MRGFEPFTISRPKRTNNSNGTWTDKEANTHVVYGSLKFHSTGTRIIVSSHADAQNGDLIEVAKAQYRLEGREQVPGAPYIQMMLVRTDKPIDPEKVTT